MFFVLFDSTTVYQKYIGFAYYPELFDVSKEESIYYKDIIEKNYQAIDTVIGQLMKRIDENTTVILVSDHGYGREDIHAGEAIIKPTYFNINKLLKEFNYLNIEPENWKLSLSQKIVWSETKAYFCNNLDTKQSGVCMNLYGRDEQGLVNLDEYKDLTLEIKDILESVEIGDIKLLKNIKINNGKPDITFEFNKPAIISYYIIKSELFGSNIKVKVKDMEFDVNDLFMYNSLFAGDHELNGIFLISNKNIKFGNIQPLNLIDIAPTVLYSLDLGVPGYMDTTKLSQIYTEEYLLSNPIKYNNISSDFIRERKDLNISEEENEAVRRSFLQLGYDV